jgi:hypothetical protein
VQKTFWLCKRNCYNLSRLIDPLNQYFKEFKAWLLFDWPEVGRTSALFTTWLPLILEIVETVGLLSALGFLTL